MKVVYVLQHEYEWFGRDEVKFIGVYASKQDAEAAIERLKHQPGFRDWPDGFCISAYEIGRDHWDQGFSTMVTIMLPVRNAEQTYVAAGAVWYPGDTYRICRINPHNPEYQLAYSDGDYVHCQTQEIDGEDGYLVASSKADEPA